MTGTARGGGVLVLTLLVMVAMELLAHGVLLVARQQMAASLADVRILRGRAGARAAAAAAAVDLRASALEEVPLGGALEGAGPRLGDVGTRWGVRRLTREAWLSEGWARVGPAPWEAREARLLWRMDPAARVAAFAAVAEVGGLRGTHPEGVVQGLSPGEECGEAGAVLDTLLPRGLPALSGASEGRVSRGGLGPVTWESAVAAVPGRLVGTGAPAPADSAGTCVDRPWNWGDPSDPGAPCGGHRPWRAASGDLTAVGGSGQGALLILGDVTLVGTRYRGVVLARGGVHLRQGTELQGLVLAGGALEVDSSSRVVGSACAALAAFKERPDALAALLAVDGVGWLPVP